MASVLKNFYVGPRKSDGFNRYFKTKETNIIKESEFAELNKLFLAKCVDLERQGLAKVIC